MHFCPECKNMLYLKLSEEDENQLLQYCRKCGYSDTSITQEDVCVLSTSVKRSEEKYALVVNEYTRNDPTLPRTSTIRCPNSACKTNKGDAARDVIFLRYDDQNLQYVYMCSVCETTWKTSSQV